MKTKGAFWRYPSKISLLKDLRRGYPWFVVSLLSQVYENKWLVLGYLPARRWRKGYLSRAALGCSTPCVGTHGITSGSLCWHARSNCQRARTTHCCFQTANVLHLYVSLIEPSSQAARPAHAGHGGEEQGKVPACNRADSIPWKNAQPSRKKTSGQFRVLGSQFVPQKHTFRAPLETTCAR
jgi:hypothetical protein